MRKFSSARISIRDDRNTDQLRCQKTVSIFSQEEDSADSTLSFLFILIPESECVECRVSRSGDELANRCLFIHCLPFVEGPLVSLCSEAELKPCGLPTPS